MAKEFTKNDASNAPHLNQITEESRLNFRECNVTDDFAKAIAESLKKNHKYPNELDLSNNQITDVGALALQEALEINNSLILIDLRGNNISFKILEEINKSLLRNMENKAPKLTLEDLREPLPEEIRNYEEAKKNQDEFPVLFESANIAPIEVLLHQNENKNENSVFNPENFREPFPEGYQEEEPVVHIHLSRFIGESENKTKLEQEPEMEQSKNLAKYLSPSTDVESSSNDNSIPNSAPSQYSSTPRTSIAEPIAVAFKIEETKGNSQG